MKTKFKDQIRELLNNHDNPDIIYFYDDIFHVIKDCKLIKIPQSEAVQYLESAELWHLMQDKRKFDMDFGQWVGEIPVHILPSGLPECKVINVNMHGQTFEEFMQLFLFFSRQCNAASKNPKITGIEYIIPKE